MEVQIHNIRRRHQGANNIIVQLCIHHIIDVKTVAPYVVQVVTMAWLPAGCCRLCIDLTTEL